MLKKINIKGKRKTDKGKEGKNRTGKRRVEQEHGTWWGILCCPEEHACN